MSSWDLRYNSRNYIFGKEPSQFLTQRESLFQPGQVALMVADGEGRNGVFLAGKGLRIHSVDGSTVALRKAKRLADEAGVQMVIEQADVMDWSWYENAYDHVVGIMIQFADPNQRETLFANMKRALKPGGLFHVHGFHVDQIQNNSGGPRDPDHLYTRELLTAAFDDFEIVELSEETRTLDDGPAHSGPAALINLVARKPKSDGSADSE